MPNGYLTKYLYVKWIPGYEDAYAFHIAIDDDEFLERIIEVLRDMEGVTWRVVDDVDINPKPPFHNFNEDLAIHYFGLDIMYGLQLA